MPRKFWKITNQAEAETADIQLYGEIASESWFEDDVTPKMFSDELNACAGKPINVHINSLGGDVFAAQLMYTAIKNYPGTVNVYIDGICASAATIIASAGDRVFMPVNALYMIHNPSTVAWGDAKEMRKVADTLDTIRQTIVNVYTARSKVLSEQQVKNLMNNETWMAADEALENGFVDEIVGRATVEDDGDTVIVNSVRFDIHKFKNKKCMRDILAREEVHNEVKDMDNKTLLEQIKDLLGGKPEGAESEVQDNAADPVAEERARVAALDAAKTGNPFVDSIVETAKAQGQTVDQIRPYIDALPTEDAKKDEDQKAVLDAIRALIADQAKSGAENVAPSAPQNNSDDDAKKAAVDSVVNFANGGVK